MARTPEVEGGRSIARRSGIELLRIISMLMIVAHHFAVHSDWGAAATGFNSCLIGVFAAFGKVAVGIFFIITGYFLAKSVAKPTTLRGVLKLCRPVWFWAMFIFISFVLANRSNLTLENIGMAVFPISMNTYWFITTYLIIYLLSPYLKDLLDSLTNRRLIALIGTLIAVEVIPNIISVFSQNGRREYLGMVLLGILYATIGYAISRFSKILQQQKRTIYILTLISGAILALQVPIVHVWNRLLPHFPIDGLYIWVGSSIIVMVFSAGLFYIFSRFNFRIHFVNYLAGLVFGVYLIHDNAFIRQWLWRDTLIGSESVATSAPAFFLYSVNVIAAVFFISLALEAVRQATARIAIQVYRRLPVKIKR